MTGDSFSARVWQLSTLIPPGRVTTYGTLAKAAGGTALAARSITSILGKAPNQKAIPYHRIVYAGGRIWLSDSDKDQRLKMYKREKIKISERNMVVDFEEKFYDFEDLLS